MGPGILDPSFEFDNSTAVMTPGVYHGESGLREYRADIEGLWLEWRFEALDYIAAGEGVVIVPFRLVAVGRDGIETTARSTVVYRLRDGLILSAKTFQQPELAFADAGVDP